VYCRYLRERSYPSTHWVRLLWLVSEERSPERMTSIFTRYFRLKRTRAANWVRANSRWIQRNGRYHISIIQKIKTVKSKQLRSIVFPQQPITSQTRDLKTKPQFTIPTIKSNLRCVSSTSPTTPAVISPRTTKNAIKTRVRSWTAVQIGRETKLNMLPGSAIRVRRRTQRPLSLVVEG